MQKTHNPRFALPGRRGVLRRRALLTGCALLTVIALGGCGWLYHDPLRFSFSTPQMEWNERVRAGENVVAALSGRDAQMYVDITAVTDSAEIEFIAQFTAVRTVEGVRYLGGAVDRDYTYFTLPFGKIRRLIISWPIIVVLRDGGRLRLHEGAWIAAYADGELEKLIVNEGEDEEVRLRDIPAADIAAFEDGSLPDR